MTPGENTREFYREQGRQEVRPAIKYAVNNGREQLREELLEELQSVFDVMKFTEFRDGYASAMEIVKGIK